MKKKLMIAGCSYSAPSKTLPGTSWGEVLADKLGWDLVNLARQGCSNGGVRIQIEEIRRQKPDFAVITPTFWDRMEIPAAAAPYDWSTPPGHWDPPLQQHLQNQELLNSTLFYSLTLLFLYFYLLFSPPLMQFMIDILV